MATLLAIAQTKADVQIQERVFNDDFEGLVVYVIKSDRRAKDGRSSDL